MSLISGIRTALRRGLARNIVTLLFMFGIIPLGVLTLVFFSFYFEGQKLGISNVQKEIAERISSGISAHLEKTTGQIQLFARLSNLEGQGKQGLKDLAYELLDQGLEYDSITIADREGNEVCKVSRYYTFRPYELGSIALDKSFKDAVEGKTHISQIEISKFSKFPQVRITVPIIDSRDRITDVLDVGVNVAKMWELISKYRIGENRYAYIVDPKGILIAYQDISSVLQKKDLKDIQGVREFLEGKIGVSEYEGLNNDRVIGANALIPLTEWGIIVEQPVKAAYRDLYILSGVFLAIFLITVACAVFLGLRFSVRSIIGPIRRLQQEAQVIAKGEFGHRIETDRPDELGQLSESFNRMVKDLQETTVSRDLLIQEMEERKRTEEALRQSEEALRSERDKLQALMDGLARTQIGIDIVGTDYKVLFQNQTLKERFGDLTGELCYEKYMGLEKPCDFCPMIEAIKSNKVESVQLTGADGRNYELFSASLPNPDGTVDKAIEVVLDTTERKSAEEALKESEERYRILSEESPLGISLIDKEGNYKYINPKFSEIFGYTYEDIPTGREWFRKAYPDREYRHKVISTWMNDQKEYGVGESRPRTFTVTSKNGEEKTIHFKPVTMKSGDQLVIHEDVTEKQRLEAQLQRAQTMETLGTLAGGVAHDLNNILSGIVSYPDLLLMQLPEESPLRKPIVTIQNSGQKAAAIVQDLLTLARRGVATMEVVELNEIISEYLKSPECEKLRSFHPHVQIKPDLRGDLLNISGSRVHLTKTVMNLVSNAAEAMEEGGTISISTENRYIDKPIRGYDQVEEGDYVILTASDTGVGIPADDLDRIFEPFYTKKKMGRSGTGLGMAVVWGTVKDNKGYIDIESTEGKGTTFTLYFPATRKGRAKGKPLVSIEDYRGKGESILVVDDVKEQRDISSTILSELGYSVSSVSSGEEAVEYLKTRTADLLVLDMIMDPGIDGLDTYKKILELHPNQKAIIASGFSETERVKEAKNLGAGQYIRKPYTMEKIGIAVREELDK